MRQSVEAGTGDKAVEPAARQPAPLCDDIPADFMSFVRSALNCGAPFSHLFTELKISPIEVHISMARRFHIYSVN